MAALTPPAFVDTTAATASNLNAAVSELEKVNGDLDETNLKPATLITKRVIRRGAHTRHSVVASTAKQHYKVDAAPTTGTDLVQGQLLFPAGGVVPIDLPPGAWWCVVNFTHASDATELQLKWRTNNGVWSDVAGATDLPVGAFLVQIPTSTTFRTIDFGLSLGTSTLTELNIVSTAMAVVAFRVP